MYRYDRIFAMQKHRKIRNVPFPRPCGATGNDAQKLHAPAFAHFRDAAFMHEVLCRKKALHFKRGKAMIVSAAIQKMVEFYKGDLHDIDHFLKVWAMTKTVGGAGGTGRARTGDFGACRRGA